MTIPHLSSASSSGQPQSELALPSQISLLNRLKPRNNESLRLHHECHYPGRANPTDPRVSEQDCLQGIVNALGHGGLNTKQHAQLKYDLQVLAHRSLCRGIVMPSEAMNVEFAGQNLALDAIDLVTLLSKIKDDQLSVQHLLRPDLTTTSSRNESTLKAPINLRALPLAVVLGGLLIKESELTDMRQQLMHRPSQDFDLNQKQMAKAVIGQLPPVAQGGLKGVPAQLIGIDEYFKVLREAAHNNQFAFPAM